MQLPISLYGNNRNLNVFQSLHTYSNLEISFTATKLQFDTLLQAPVSSHGVSTNLNSFKIFLHLE
jgi:hypothetical protein